MPQNQRHVRLFRNGRNQAVRIPVEFELPGSEEIMFREDETLVIEPIRKRGLAALLDSWQPMAEDFPDIEDMPPEPEDIFDRVQVSAGDRQHPGIFPRARPKH